MRHIFITWLFLVASSPTAWSAVPMVTRQFSSGRIGAECAVRVRLEVEFPEDEPIPGAWLLSENWPQGWLLEEGETTPSVGNGILSYTLRAPENFSRSSTLNSADGAAYTYNDVGFTQGTMTLTPDEATQPQQFEWTFQPCWSLMALPGELDKASRDLLTSLGDGIFQVAGNQEQYSQSDVPPVGMPFWIYRNATEPIVCELTAALIADLPEPLRPAGAVRRQQWNLFGVCGDNPVRLAAGVVAWRWQNGQYERCEENAVLQPGEAVWIWVE